MKLTRNLAQEIVKNTMEVLGKNINIMDHNGIIIGSGNKKRVGNFHEVAAKVIKEEKAYIIKENETEEFKGVKEGINLPIKFQNEIVGVVGITGKNDEVANYGELVKNMVELLLEQEFLRKEIEIENKAFETFYQQVISNSIENNDLLRDRAKLLNIKLDIPRVVVLIKIEPYDSKNINNELKRIENMYIINSQDVLLIRGENIVWIKCLEDVDSASRNQKLIEMAEKVVKKLKNNSYNPTISIGQVFNKLNELHLSYQGAKQVLKVSEKVYGEERDVYNLSWLGVDYFLSDLTPYSMEYYLQHLFRTDLQQYFTNNDIGFLIEKFVTNNMNVSQTAQELCIHRNTLLYRLNKINTMTGLNPKDTKDLFALYMAYHLYLFCK